MSDQSFFRREKWLAGHSSLDQCTNTTLQADMIFFSMERCCQKQASYLRQRITLVYCRRYSIPLWCSSLRVGMAIFPVSTCDVVLNRCVVLIWIFAYVRTFGDRCAWCHKKVLIHWHQNASLPFFYNPTLHLFSGYYTIFFKGERSHISDDNSPLFFAPRREWCKIGQDVL